jgi:hypothetical protein
VELLRISRDAYGREVLQGLSWDLLWVFGGAGVALIAGHALYKLIVTPNNRRSSK